MLDGAQRANILVPLLPYETVLGTVFGCMEDGGDERVIARCLVVAAALVLVCVDVFEWVWRGRLEWL